MDRQEEQMNEAYFQTLQEKISFIAQLLPCLDDLDKVRQKTAAQLCLNLQEQLQPAIERVKTIHQETAKQLQTLAPLAAQKVNVARFIDTQG